MGVALIHSKQCLDCLELYDILEFHGALRTLNPYPRQDSRYLTWKPDLERFYALDQPKERDRDLSCPACSSVRSVGLLTVGRGVDLGGEAGATALYPRFDRGLGCIVKDRKHHRWLMTHEPDGTERAIPLRPVESSQDVVLEFHERQWAEEEQRKKKWAQQQERDRYLNRETYAKVDQLLKDNMEALKRGESNIFTRGAR
jgi:hypothetical protein